MAPTCCKSRHLGVSCWYPWRHVFAPCRQHVGQHIGPDISCLSFWTSSRHANIRHFQLSASPNRAQPWLHTEPLDVAIGRLLAPYCPSCRHGHQWQQHTKQKANCVFFLVRFYVDLPTGPHFTLETKIDFFTRELCKPQTLTLCSPRLHQVSEDMLRH